jgi:hypothetical protein
MNPRSLSLALVGFAVTLLLISCAPEAATPTVDVVRTVAAQLAAGILTQTAAAASPTPTPVTSTSTPAVTDTPTASPTSSEPPARPVINEFTGCWYGPGPAYTLESNISKGKKVELVGVGSEPGWYVIINPYFHKPCWVKAEYLTIDPAMDLSALPMMTPGPP